MNLSIQQSEITEQTERLQNFNLYTEKYLRGEVSEEAFMLELSSIETINLLDENMFNQMLGNHVLAAAYRSLKIRKLSYSQAYYIDEYVYKEISYLHNVQYIVTRVTKEQWAALYLTSFRTACFTYYCLANAYDHIGRFNEAQQYYTMAAMNAELKDEIDLNRGFSYANTHSFYREEEPWVVRRAQLLLQKHAQEIDEANPGLRQGICSCTVPSFEPPLTQYPETEDGQYDHWVNENYLRLNRYVDIEPHSKISQADNVMLPHICEKQEKVQLYKDLFEEMTTLYKLSIKTMYKTFCNETIEDIHNLKSAYKDLYSILDKLAEFISLYLCLPIKAHNIDFRTLWSTNRRHFELRNQIAQRNSNLSLLAIYNIKVDVYGSDVEGFVADELTQNLQRIRNFIEHKSIKVVDEPMTYTDYQLRISKHELSLNAIRLAQLVRCSLIYLCNFVLHEEYERHET